MSKIQKSSLVNCYKCFYPPYAGLRFCVHKSEAPREAGRFLFYITFILLTKLLID